MELLNNKLYLYNVDIKYIEYLHGFDNEVFFDRSPEYKNKPYVGIIINVNGIKYFIPLTSAKEKHKKLKNSGDSYILIYENIPLNQTVRIDTSNWILNTITINQTLYTKHILSVLELKKMIPIPDGCYAKTDINALSNLGKKRLLIKEYEFLKNKYDIILKKVNKLYNNQIKTGKIYPGYCNFSLLEEKSKEYKLD